MFGSLRMISKTRNLRFLLYAILIAGVSFANAAESKDLFHNQAEWTKGCFATMSTPPKETILPELFPVVIEGTPGRNFGSEQLFAPVVSIAYPMANLGSACMTGDHTACQQFSDWLEKLADTDSLRFERDKHKKSQSSLVTGELSGNSTLRPIALYMSILRRHNLITLKDRTTVFDWMRRRVGEYSHISGKESESELAQNLVLNSAVTQLAVGIATSDPSLTTGVEKVYRAYIDTMRADGSFPAESQRGQSALKYENDAIGLLVLAGEAALLNGTDLYAYKGPNGDIHKAIHFWLDALQDEKLISPYAAANVAPTDPAQQGGKQALYFLGIQRDMIQMGWIIPYVKRFPDSDNVATIRRLIDHGRISVRDNYDSLLTVYPSCVWGAFQGQKALHSSHD
ncbi:alginate lyase [Paraburkholderia sp. RAU2J]|uniref:alginate lyase family protein n=1 Tax=Paraburkholderia sp. RAU2J TaxID=1938810 RepID=UPI000F237242|nr:alginate lyase family protein [Paraburkholderia sp. RAU2J]RKT21666.1 alginate lyase [Paraburkholderia sp. RAU2J]